MVASIQRARKIRALAIIAVLVVGVWYFLPRLIVEWQTSVARAALNSSKFAAALSALEVVERWQPSRAETAYLRSRAYRRLGDFPHFESELETARIAGWPETDLQSQFHLSQIQSGRFDASQAWLQRTLAGKVSDELAEEVYEAQAKGFIRTHRLNDAVVCLNFWIEWKPAAVQPHLWLAQVWERCDRWQSAAGEYQSVLNLAPHHFEARLGLADNLLKLNDFEDALKNYEECARVAPDDASVGLGMARCLRRLGMLDDAERELLRRLSRFPEGQRPVELVVELGQIALFKRDTPGAVKLFHEALHQDPLEATAHSSLAAAYLRLGESELAAEHQHKSDEINRRYDRLTEIVGLLTDAPGNADLRFEAGQILMEQGRKSDGADWMSTALLVNPTHAPTHRALSEYFASIGDSERAELHLREARQSEDSESGSKPNQAAR